MTAGARLQEEGYVAALGGTGREECPWSPSSPEGRRWLLGWTSGRMEVAHATGEAARETDRQRALMRADFENDPAYRPDPAAVILGIEPERHEVWRGTVRAGVSWGPFVKAVEDFQEQDAASGQHAHISR